MLAPAGGALRGSRTPPRMVALSPNSPSTRSTRRSGNVSPGTVTAPERSVEEYPNTYTLLFGGAPQAKYVPVESVLVSDMRAAAPMVPGALKSQLTRTCAPDKRVRASAARTDPNTIPLRPFSSIRPGQSRAQIVASDGVESTSIECDVFSVTAAWRLPSPERSRKS